VLKMLRLAGLVACPPAWSAFHNSWSAAEWRYKSAARAPFRSQHVWLVVVPTACPDNVAAMRVGVQEHDSFLR
jgi:hypothetical protein